MLIHDSCQEAIRCCTESKTFAIARMYNGEKTMDIHIHDCCEIYYSISGGKEFLIDNRVYEFGPGDLFFINQFESHHLSEVDQSNYERVVLSVWPEYLRELSTPNTDLETCFTHREPDIGPCLHLTGEERRLFLYYINKLSEPRGFGQDVLEKAAFTELMTFLNRSFLARCAQDAAQPDRTAAGRPRHTQIDEILSYINQHLAEDLSIPLLASRFYLSGSYLCRIFKEATGTTINRYITAKRISRAKSLLAEGRSVAETASLCGFGDYSNFLKAFTRTVGMSPKKFVSCLHR